MNNNKIVQHACIRTSRIKYLCIKNNAKKMNSFFFVFWEKKYIGWQRFFLWTKKITNFVYAAYMALCIWKKYSLTWSVRKQPPIKCIIVIYNNFSYLWYDFELVSQQKRKWLHIFNGSLQLFELTVICYIGICKLLKIQGWWIWMLIHRSDISERFSISILVRKKIIGDEHFQQIFKFLVSIKYQEMFVSPWPWKLGIDLK